MCGAAGYRCMMQLYSSMYGMTGYMCGEEVGSRLTLVLEVSRFYILFMCPCTLVDV